MDSNTPANGVRGAACQAGSGDDGVEFGGSAQTGAMAGQGDQVCFAVVLVKVVGIEDFLDQQYPTARQEVLGCARRRAEASASGRALKVRLMSTMSAAGLGSKTDCSTTVTRARCCSSGIVSEGRGAASRRAERADRHPRFRERRQTRAWAPAPPEWITRCRTPASRSDLAIGSASAGWNLPGVQGSDPRSPVRLAHPRRSARLRCCRRGGGADGLSESVDAKHLATLHPGWVQRVCDELVGQNFTDRGQEVVARFGLS